MKRPVITFYFRDKRKGNYSIEQIFQNIGELIKDEFEIRYFTVNPNHNWLQNISNAKAVQGDVNHITGDVNWLAYGLSKKTTILTIHDLGHFENTLRGWKRIVYKNIWLDWPFRKVAKITAISSFTKERIDYHFHEISSKVVVIHNPVNSIFENPVNLNLSPTQNENTILQIGQMKNKNLETLVEAVIGLDIKLLLLRPYDYDLSEKLKTKGIKHQFFESLNQQQLINLYKEASLLWFASTYEGFGMPIIEAQALGIPVITSTCSSMPEVAGEGALFIDPLNVSEAKKAIEKILGSKDLRKGLIAKGNENIKRFKLCHIVGEYKQLYHSILEGK